MTNNQDYDQLSVTIEKLLDKFVGSQVIGISLWNVFGAKSFSRLLKEITRFTGKFCKGVVLAGGECCRHVGASAVRLKSAGPSKTVAILLLEKGAYET